MSPEELEIYSEFTGSGVRDPYIGLYTDDEKFGYYECFVFADGVRGLFQKGYDSTTISNDFSLSFYDDQGYAYIVNQQGDVLLQGITDSDYEGTNILDMVGEAGSGEKSRISVMSALKERKTNVVFSGDSEDDYVFTCVPIENVDEWYLISIVPRAVMMDEATHIISNTRALFFASIGVLAFFAVFGLLIQMSQEKMRKKDLEIKYQEELFDVFSTYLSTNTDDVYMMFGEKGQCLEYISPNAERVMGVARPADIHAVIGLDCGEKDGIKRDIYSELQELKPGEALKIIETGWINPETKEHKWFKESVYCVSIQNMEKIVVYISDRTKEQEIQNTLSAALETAQVASEAKSTFLSSISHDIRTPMNAIMGLVTLLRQEADNPEYVLEYSEKIDAASQHLLGLINDVLDMNKIESGAATLNIDEVNLAEIIDELNMIIRPQTRERHQEFIISTSPFTCEHLLGDKLRINQILINVLSNAVKYTQNGGRIELSVRELPRFLENYNRIEFKVIDNGQGMTEEYQKIIFSPFTREHDTGTNKVQGTGLGMAITKSLVDLMGGTIRVESKVGEGSTFTIELELHQQEQQVDLKFWKRYNVNRMLVADDDIETCENVVRIMSKTGVTVHFVTSGENVIRTIREARENGQPYDILLLDWKMPQMDGMETARLVRKNYPHKLPILIFTAYDWQEIEQEALEIGITHFLAKPFFMSSFKSAIVRIMEGRNAEKSRHAKKECSIVKDRHVLVVEDIDVNRLVLVKILTTRGAVCDVAVNGQEALEKFEQSEPGRYDFILMDVQMPVMGGYEATRKIRSSSHPEAASVPIIAMTANAFDDDVRDALRSGMDAHVSKPIVLEKLEATITDVLNNRNKE